MVRRLVLASLTLASATVAATALASFLPENNLYLQDEFEQAANLTQSDFNAVIARATQIYTPIMSQFGGTFRVSANWNDSTVNASATQLGGIWQVNMYGGLARRPEVTIDGFTLVVCHEIGHHLGGFPFVSIWGADEGQADYYATTHCAQQFWGDELEKNATFRDVIPAGPKAKCDAAWRTEDAQNLCYRTMMAGKSLADLLSALGDTTADFDTPDTHVVRTTNHDHPEGQCRLDTYMAGATCTQDYEKDIIPGKSFGSSRNGREAEGESAQHYCASRDFEQGTRPLCWFHPAI
jgi:hypothetical protein